MTPIEYEYMTYPEAAEFLRMSRRTLERYVNHGQIPRICLPSGTVRFDRHELRRWMKKYGQKEAPEVKDQGSVLSQR